MLRLVTTYVCASYANVRFGLFNAFNAPITAPVTIKNPVLEPEHGLEILVSCGLFRLLILLMLSSVSFH